MAIASGQIRVVSAIAKIWACLTGAAILANFNGPAQIIFAGEVVRSNLCGVDARLYITFSIIGMAVGSPHSVADNDFEVGSVWLTFSAISQFRA